MHGGRLKTGNQQKLDIRGLIIPFTVLKVSLALKNLDDGDTLEVLWSDPDTQDDLFKVLPAASYDLIELEEIQGDTPCYRMTLLKRRKERSAGPRLRD